jgi:prepilin-type N-terminal cleavage/methylation domain-containing protein
MTQAVPNDRPVDFDAISASRRGFSLVELLVASGLGLVVMASVASLFSIFGRSVTQGQARVEFNGYTRGVAWRLRQDLVGLTCPARPTVRSDANAGYLQIVNGSAPAGDTLSLTTSSQGAPFSGRLDNAKGFESPTAEVAWFCEVDPGKSHAGQQLYTLHRRQLLVAAAPDAGTFVRNVFASRGTSDLSWAGGQALSLGDLSRAGNRFLATTTPTTRKLVGPREGEDVVLRGVLGFDVRLIEATGAVDRSFDTVEGAAAGAPPLRGVEIRIRCLDPSNNQPREVRVAHAF